MDSSRAVTEPPPQWESDAAAERYNRLREDPFIVHRLALAQASRREDASVARSFMREEPSPRCVH